MNTFIHPTAIIEDGVRIGEGTKIWHFCHIRQGVKMGKDCILGKGIYVDHDVEIGNNVKIQNNVSLYFEAKIGNGVFIGPHACFTNDKIPRAINPDKTLKQANNWNASKIFVKEGASIGANATILPGITIGKFAMIGAGSLVTKDVPDYTLFYGNPAKIHGYVCKCGKKLINKCPVCKICLSNVKK